mgnify:CR=1 FL=1
MKRVDNDVTKLGFRGCRGGKEKKRNRRLNEPITEKKLKRTLARTFGHVVDA